VTVCTYKTRLRGLGGPEPEARAERPAEPTTVGFGAPRSAHR